MGNIKISYKRIVGWHSVFGANSNSNYFRKIGTPKRRKFKNGNRQTNKQTNKHPDIPV